MQDVGEYLKLTSRNQPDVYNCCDKEIELRIYQTSLSDFFQHVNEICKSTIRLYVYSRKYCLKVKRM